MLLRNGVSRKEKREAEMSIAGAMLLRNGFHARPNGSAGRTKRMEKIEQRVSISERPSCNLES